MVNLVMVNPSLAPLVDTLTPMSPIPLGVITWPLTTAARLKFVKYSDDGPQISCWDNYRNSLDNHQVV